MRVHKIYLLKIILLFITLGCNSREIPIPENLIDVTFKQDKLDYIIIENITDSNLYNVELTIYNFDNRNNNFNNLNAIPPDKLLLKEKIKLIKPKVKNGIYLKRNLSKDTRIFIEGNYKKISKFTNFTIDNPLEVYKK